MNRQRLAEQYDSYAREVLPTNAPRVQRSECRRAFYSGAAAMHAVIMASLSPGGDVTDSDLNAMEEIMGEFMAFNERVRAGTA